MKTIKIFLASSEELKEERLELADLVEHLNNSLAKRDINIQLVKWEYLDSSMGPQHKQEEYNKELRQCEMCLVLYWTKFGKYTKTELDTAYKELCAGHNPQKLYIYFKDSDEVTPELKEFRESFPQKYGHFYNRFANIDTLKADFLLQFTDYQSKQLGNTSLVEVKDSQVTIDGKVYVDLKKVPFAGNNEEYNLLLKNIKKTQKLLTITEEDDPDYADYTAELKEMKEKLAKMESSLWDTALIITRLSTTKCSERLKRAMDLFTAGDNKGAQAVLNEEEIEHDVEHNLHLIQLGEEGKKGLKINIEEYQLKIKTLENEMSEGWLLEQSKLHDRIIELSISLYGEYSIEAAQAMMDATPAVYLLEDYSKLKELTQHSLNIRLNILGENHLDTAQCYNDLGIALGKLGDNQRYIEYVRKGLEIRLALNANEELLAESYNNTGEALLLNGDKSKFLEYELKALELRIKAHGEMNLETANSYSQVGIAYSEIEDDEKYLEYSLKSLEIRQALVGERHPDTAHSHNNVAIAYMSLNKYPESIFHLKKALDISIVTIGKLKPNTLLIYDNLSFIYEQNEEIEKSIDYTMEAIDISEKINGSIHPQTLVLYERAGRLLSDYGDKNAALDYLYRALDIRFKIAEEESPNGPLPTFELADLYHEIGEIHYFAGDCTNAERMINNSINIMSDVNEIDPILGDWCFHLGMIYGSIGKHEKALTCFQDSLNRKLSEYGEDNVEISLAYEGLGNAHAALGEKALALEAFQKSLEILQKCSSNDVESIERVQELIKGQS